MNTPPKGEGLYNVIAIGAGAGGLITTGAIAGLKGRAALIERRKMGGDCLNYGCVPSKAIIASARLANAIDKAPNWGLPENQANADPIAVLKDMRRLRAKIEPNDSVERYESLGVDVIEGDAAFTSPNTLEVNGQTLRAKHFVIAAGSRASVPPIPGIEDVPYHTNESIFDELNDKLESLIIIGCGPIGCELGQSFQRLGVQVSMVQRSPNILPKEDHDVAGLVAKTLESEGVQLYAGYPPVRVSHENGKIHLVVAKDGQEQSLKADALFVAAGRRPNTESLGLEAAGVRFDKKGVHTDAYMRTSQKHIFAVGDIAGPYQFTHLADYHARLVVENIIRGILLPSILPAALRFKKVDYTAFPWATYTSPEIGQVGLNEKAAKAAAIPYDVFKAGFEHIDRAILERHPEGFVKVLTQKGTDKIIGATIVGEHAGDLLHELVLAMHNKIGLKKIAAVTHAYPTHAEVIRRVADAYKRSTFTPKLAAMFERKFTKHRR